MTKAWLLGKALHYKEKDVVGRSGAFGAVVCVAIGLSTPCVAHQTTFNDYTPLASNLELARRLLTPLTSDQVPERLLVMGKGLREQPIDLSKEKFSVYVPSKTPATGYGLIVFIPPWQDSHIPEGWVSVFDRLGFIFVSALRSGNEESVLGRRMPLAILAAYNAMQRYHIDGRRVFISGFSGGSRVAMRLAVAYPDLFAGAFLDAGSDPVGGSEIPLPPRNLFEQFRHSSMLVYASGSLDDIHLAQDAASLGSMRKWCVSGTVSHTVFGLGHDTVPGAILSNALTALSAEHAPASSSSDDCWSRTIARLEVELSDVEETIERREVRSARKRLKAIDLKYGGIASPRISDLERRLDTLSPSHQTH